MFTFLLVVQILVSFSIIGLVMLQQGKGADMGAGFGSGASGTVFGARGSGSFFTRATGILAAVFFINCLLIASPLVRRVGQAPDSIAEQLEQSSQAESKTDEENRIIKALEQVQTQTEGPGDVPLDTGASKPDSSLPAASPDAAPVGPGDLPE